MCIVDHVPLPLLFLSSSTRNHYSAINHRGSGGNVMLFLGSVQQFGQNGPFKAAISVRNGRLAKPLRCSFCQFHDLTWLCSTIPAVQNTSIFTGYSWFVPNYCTSEQSCIWFVTMASVFIPASCNISAISIYFFTPVHLWLLHLIMQYPWRNNLLFRSLISALNSML